VQWFENVSSAIWFTVNVSQIFRVPRIHAFQYFMSMLKQIAPDPDDIAAFTGFSS
jgi:hypothetical protein